MFTACDEASPSALTAAFAPPEDAWLRMASSSVTKPELEPLKLHIERLQTLVDVDLFLFGDAIWLRDESDALSNWLGEFLARVEEASAEGAKVSTIERGQLLQLPLPLGITDDHVNRFLDRWNRTMDYWAAEIFNLADVPAGQSTDFLALDLMQTKLAAAIEAEDQSLAEGFTSIIEGVEHARQEVVRFYEKDSGGGECATIRLRIEQEAVLTRDAFDASLEIINSTGDSLENISVEIVVRNENGEIATSLFGIRPPVLSGLGAVDGTGVIQPNTSGKASWIIVPTSEAAPESETVFLVSGMLNYRQGDLAISIPLAPASISVLPSASLQVKYFNQRDVFSDDPFTPEIEPSIPFSLGVLIHNRGFGTARNMRITSAQPKIIENEKGLLIDFSIIATEVAGQNLSPSLTANFGDIGPGETAVGRWLMTSTLQGLFIDYDASFEHVDGLGDPRLSLIESVEIHELIHVLRAGAGRFDFLVNDVPDLQDLPDTLHLGDGRVEPVSLATQAAVDGTPVAGDLEVGLTVTMPSGWAYLRMPDPGDGAFRLARVLRLDGSEVPLGDNVWTTDRTFIGNAQRPIRENVLHLLDHDSAGVYTLIYEEPAAPDLSPPISAVEALPPNSYRQIPVRWSGEDDPGGSGIESFDIFVSINSGPFQPWLQRTTLTGAIYDGMPGASYAFYSVAVDRAGNQESPPTAPDTETLVDLANSAPILSVPSNAVIDEGQTLIIAVTATDPDVPANRLTFTLDPGAPAGAVIDPNTGVLRWITSEADGPGTRLITVRVTDNGDPSLSDTGTIAVTVNEVNLAPVLAPIAERTVYEGDLLTIHMVATDSDLPPNQLTFDLGPDAPSGATISPSGRFEWRPTALQSPSTNQITIVVTDDGTPSLSATQPFIVIVLDRLQAFTVMARAANGQITLSWIGAAGRSYRVVYKDHLNDAAWQRFTPDAVGLGDGAELSFEDAIAGNAQRFYLIELIE